MNNSELYNIELDTLAKEREELKAKQKEYQKQIDKINKLISEKLGTVEDYKTDNFHYVHKIVIVPEHIVKESISQPLKIYNA